MLRVEGKCKSCCLEASVFLSSAFPVPAPLDPLSPCYFLWLETFLFCPGNLVEVNLSLRGGRELYVCLDNSPKNKTNSSSSLALSAWIQDPAAVGQNTFLLFWTDHWGPLCGGIQGFLREPVQVMSLVTWSLQCSWGHRHGTGLLMEA